ncbi:CD320 antigen isoform X2 [Phalacrocorax aristotelis]|uniref:CD320 antigen isoform X2 n=1 Tax=Phalacrocorax aristotelis TaxID=126867 RepID=UPI003F4B2AC1
MARLLVLRLMLLLPVLLLLVLLPLPPHPPGNASLPGCPPGLFQCEPGAVCFPREWRCDGHPDCEDEGDESGCGTAAPAETSPDGDWTTPPRSWGVPPAETSATPVPGSSVPSGSQGHMWILIIAGADVQWFSACALSSPVLLSILVAVGSIAVWSLSKAKSRFDILSVEKASREQLMPEQSQTGLFPQRRSLP